MTRPALPTVQVGPLGAINYSREPLTRDGVEQIVRAEVMTAPGVVECQVLVVELGHEIELRVAVRVALPAQRAKASKAAQAAHEEILDRRPVSVGVSSEVTVVWDEDKYRAACAADRLRSPGARRTR